MEKKFEDWINRNTNNGEAWKNLDDIHVDSAKNNWLKKGVLYYRIVNNHLSKNNLPFYAELSIRLKYSKVKTGVNFDSLFEIEKQLSSTPPSLYLFPRNYKNLERNKNKSILIDSSIFGEENAFYEEIFDKSEKEYFRAIFIIPLI